MEQSKARSYFFYAFGEIALVMIGILLALQVNNWNQERANAVREQAILHDLHDEFKENLEQLDYITSQHTRSLNSINWLIDHHPNYESVVDSLAYHINLMMSAYTYNPSQSGVQALINTSSFELIQNNELRQRLITWSDLFQDYAEEELISRQLFFDQILPFLNQYVDIEFLISGDEIDDQDIASYQTRVFKNLLIGRKVTIDYNILNSAEDELQKLRQVTIEIIELTQTE